ncbi:unnamed protein product [Echinostoma caproni]|uniref:N(6)-adenosine-methyltransferase non-catalytic subunit METTL14 n=1 Tax=Echinostoma caproni TaxID=27848 RepID=A0A3P8BIN0_9TREM|nr:unnamed protein product [Echinostoma caproni]
MILSRKLGLAPDDIFDAHALLQSRDLKALVSSRWDVGGLNKSGPESNTETTFATPAAVTQMNRKDGDKRDTEEFMVKTYTGSATFLKGTQSANPHNDYCQHFVDTGERPQNFIRDTGLRNRFEEYPKLRELIRLKDSLIESRTTPPMYLRADLKTFDLNELQSKFDVVLIEPPLEEYHRMTGAVFDQHWTWSEVCFLVLLPIFSRDQFS